MGPAVVGREATEERRREFPSLGSSGCVPSTALCGSDALAREKEEEAADGRVRESFLVFLRRLIEDGGFKGDMSSSSAAEERVEAEEQSGIERAIWRLGGCGLI